MTNNFNGMCYFVWNSESKQEKRSSQKIAEMTYWTKKGCESERDSERK